jgi:hypothetical protein
MPQRQYFYTPIVNESHNIGEQDVNGDWVSSNSSAPGVVNPSDPMGAITIMSADSLICLRVDENSNRCVVSLPQSITQIHIKDAEIFQQIELGSVLGASAHDWQQKSRSQIESDYQSVDPSAPDAQIDFTVEEE